MSENEAENLIKNIRKHLRQDYDTVIVITGTFEGVGKSTLMQFLGFKVDDNFDQIKNICYIPTSEQIIEKFNGINRYGLLGLDEGSEVFYKMDFMSEVQTSLVKMLKRDRKENKAVVICIPQFTDLAKSVRDGKVKLWIHILKRGKAVVNKPFPNPYGRDKWLIDEYEKEYRKYFKNKKSNEINADDMERFFETKVKTYCFSFEFPSLPDEKWQIYTEQVKKERDTYYARLKDEQNERDRKTSAIVQLLVELKFRHRYSQKELASLTGYTPSRISKLLKDENYARHQY